MPAPGDGSAGGGFRGPGEPPDPRLEAGVEPGQLAGRARRVQRERTGQGDGEAPLRLEQPDGGGDPRSPRDDDPGDPERPRKRAGVERPRPSERHHRVVARVTPPLEGHGAERPLHVRVGDAVHAPGGSRRVEAERLADLRAGRALRRLPVDPELPAREGLGGRGSRARGSHRSGWPAARPGRSTPAPARPPRSPAPPRRRRAARTRCCLPRPRSRPARRPGRRGEARSTCGGSPPSTSNEEATAGSPPSMTPTLAVVPPMSKVITRSTPSRDPIARHASTPAAGPDSMTLTGYSRARAGVVSPPLDCMTRSSPVNPREAKAASSPARNRPTTGLT